VKRPPPRRAQRRPPIPLDLGPVKLKIEVQAEPRVEPPRPGGAPQDEGGGLLASLPAVHGRGWVGHWSVALGTETIKLDLGEGLVAAEELLVFLLELVDEGHGEWTLFDREGEALIIEAQVHGPDVALELGGEDGPPRWNGRKMPQRATVRLRAVVDQGTSALRALLKQAARIDADFGADGSLKGVWDDLDALKEAVAELPRGFAPKADA
jgi:hypothetical protein